jgi:YD repeat-containing protein
VIAMTIIVRSILASLLFWSSLQSAIAGDTLPGYYQDPGVSPFRTTVNHNLDEHVDPFNGMLQLHHQDAVLPGNGGFDLVLQRSFNSPTPGFGNYSDTTSYNKTPNVGIGWSLFVGGRLYVGPACNQVDGQMIFETPDGGRQALLGTGNGDFLSPARWRALCVVNGVQVYAPNGTRYDMFQVIPEAIPNTIQGASFYYPTQIVDRNGNSATFSWGPQSGTTLLNSVSTSDGRSITFTYTLTGAVYLMTRASTVQGSWTYTYQQAFANLGGQGVAFFLTRVTPPAGLSWSYSYNACNPPIAGSCSINQLTYPEGGSISYNYSLVNFNDGSGNTSVVSSKSAPSGQWTFNYAPGVGGNYDTTTVSTPLGTLTYNHFGYGSVGSGSAWKIGLLVQRTAGSLQTDTYTWDKQQISPYPMIRAFGITDNVTSAPLMTGHTITRGGGSYTTTYASFDQYGNPQTIAESGDRVHTTTRAYFTNPAKWIINIPANESTSGIAGSITRGFDTNGNLTSQSRYGVSTTYGYDSQGNGSSMTNANSRTTTYGLYYRSVPQTESRPEGVTINRSVSQNGDILSQTDGAGNTYTYNYDALRRMSQAATPAGSPTNIAWSQNTSRTATRGSYTETLSLDNLANPASVTRNSITTRYSYDAFSNKTFESLPASASGTQFTRDILGRVTTMRNADGTSRIFTYGRSLVSVQDERGKTTTYVYSAFGDPDKKFLTAINLPNGNNITIGRDDLGNMTSVTQGSFTRTYGYNGSYFLTSVSDPETGTTTYGRDAVGNMTSSTIGGRTTNFTYDGLNRLTNIQYPNGQSVAITYLGNGRTSSITSDQATRTYGYDANANLISETLNVGGQSFTVGYSYNTNDALATVTYPITNETVSYSPDVLGRPTSASPYVTSVGHYASGNVSTMSYANGVTMSFQENSRHWPSGLSATSGASFLNRSYGYDAVGNVTQITDTANPTQSMTMSYDTISQLTSVTGPWGAANLSYDAVGNLTLYNLGGTTRSYFYANGNRLTTFNSQIFAYDSYGNVTSDGIHSLQYDDASNLTCLDCPTAGQITYAYDGNNRRVTRTQNGVTTYFVHGSNGDLLLEYTPTQNTTVEHVYLQGKRIATKTIQ